MFKAWIKMPVADASDRADWPRQHAWLIDQVKRLHKTALPGGHRESRSDVLAIGRHGSALVTCTIEGKVNEPFGPTVGEWLVDASPGKTQRLTYLCDLLGIGTCPPDVHYQLLHRTASALIEADRFHAHHAAMIVHSFSPERRWFEAFERFVSLLGAAVANETSKIAHRSGDRRLILGWAHGDPAFLTARDRPVFQKRERRIRSRIATILSLHHRIDMSRIALRTRKGKPLKRWRKTYDWSARTESNRS